MNGTGEDNVLDFDPVRDYISEQRRSVSSALQGLTDDPVKAARAQELSEATGVHPSLVYGDLDNFESQHKAQLVGQLVDNSDFLRRYVDEFPLAAKISGNDYGNLDTYGEKLTEFGDIPTYRKWAYSISRGIENVVASTAEGLGAKGAPERYAEFSKKQMASVYGTPSANDMEDWLKTIPGQVGSGAGGMFALAPSFLAGGIPLAAIHMGIMGGGEAEKRAAASGADENTRGTAYTLGFISNAVLGILPFDKLLKPAAATAPGLMNWSTTKLTEAAKFGGIFAVFGEMQHATNEYLAKVLHDPKAGYTPDASRIISTFLLGGILGLGFHKVKPYVDAGVDPPLGLHPEMDKLKIMESEHDFEKYDEALKAAQKSETKEMSPELFAGAGRLQTDASIGIHIDAIEKMYGEKAPEAGDGKLGFIKGIGDQIELARSTGGDVHVPLADWLAHVDPATAKELQDDIRIRDNGLTKNEIKATADVGREEIKPEEVKPEEQITPEVTEAVRTSADLATIPERMKRSGEEIFGGKFETIGPDLKILQPKDWHPTELKAIEAANAELEKLIPQGKVEGTAARLISFEKRPVSGVFQQFKEKVPTIVYLANPETAVGTVRHEAIHYLRREGFFTREEWDTLKQAAHYNNWLDKHDIKERYKGQSAPMMIEEAIAEEFKVWRQKPETTSLAGKVFQKLQDLSNKVVDAIQRAIGSEQAANEIFKRVESGEIGSREGAKPLDQRAFGAAPDRGDLSLKLKTEAKPDKDIEGSPSGWGEVSTSSFTHLYDLNHKEKGKVGEISLSYNKDTKDVYIHWIGKNGYNADQLKNQFGASALRGILGEIKKEFPDAESITGNRITGAREAAGAKSEASIPIESLTEELGKKQENDFFSAIRNFMGKDRYDRYTKLIEKQNAEDTAYKLKKVEEAERAKQSKEWKANESRVRDEVAHDVEGRPDIAATRFMTDYGYKFASDGLTPEQREALPRSMVAKDGVSPDAVAGMFGYHSGNTMVDHIASLNAQRGEVPFKDFVEQSIRSETERRMQEKYGVAKDQAIEDAKDHVLSPTQMDMLHEQTLALGVHAGLEMEGYSKAKIQAALKDKFGAYKVSAAKADAFLRDAGRAGRAMEEAFLKDDMTEAFRQSQRQYLSTLAAKEARAFDKEQTQFDKVSKRFQKREVGGVPAEYTNFVHQILIDVGEGVKGRSVQDLQTEIAASGHKDLAGFVKEKEGDLGLRIIPVADGLMDGSLKKPINEMTVDEFRAVKQSVDTLIKNGRDEQKIIHAGDEMDLKSALDEMKEKLQTFPKKEYPLNTGRLAKAVRLPKTYLAAGTNMETLLNRWDRNDPRGIFNRWLVRPLSEAANYKARLDREFSKEYQAIGKVVDKDKLVDSPLVDPLSGEQFQGFTRNNIAAMVQNAGNHSNWEVLTKGYNVEPKALWNWLMEHTTKEDWDRAQRMGDMFEKAGKLSDEVYRRVSGVAPQKVEIQPIETPFGTYRGWYHPLMYDHLREGHSKKLMGGTADLKGENDYFRASTADGYTKRRTGYVAPLDLNFDMVPIRLSQMLHNIAFREPVINTGKVFYDRGFRNEVTKHYGDIYKDGLVPYLKGVAGAEGINSAMAATGQRVSEYLRQNVISTYIGFNPYTALKHGPTALFLSTKEVGAGNFARAVRSLYSQSEEIGLSNSEFAMKHSEELQRRERHWQDTIMGQHKDIYGKNTARETVIEKGSWLVAQSDMLSAKPTWVAKYKSGIEEGLDHGSAVYEADRAVRRAHGSTAITNQPAIVRGGGALHGWLTSVYGFFGTMMQRRIEIAHEMNDTYKLAMDGEIKKAAGNVPGLTASVFAYVIWPTIVEEWVTSLTTDDKRGWGTHLFTGAMMGMGASFIYVRDIVHALTTGRDPGVGLLSSTLHDFSNMARDLRKGKNMINKENAGKLVGDTLTVLGGLTGLAPKTVDNAIRFGIDLVNKQTNPKTFTDYRMGVTRGTTKKREQK